MVVHVLGAPETVVQVPGAPEMVVHMCHTLLYVHREFWRCGCHLSASGCGKG